MSKKSCNFAAKGCKDMQNNTDIFSLESTLSHFFECVTKHQPSDAITPFLRAMTSIFHCKTSEAVVAFALDDDSTAKVIDELKEHLRVYIPDVLRSLNMPLTYLLDELICNIQQHAQTDKGYAYLMYNKAANAIEIVVPHAAPSIPLPQTLIKRKSRRILIIALPIIIHIALRGYPEARMRPVRLSVSVTKNIPGSTISI